MTYTHIHSYGESHCRSVGCIVEGVPPGLKLSEEDIQPQLTRRRPGQSALATPRDEKDRVQIQSGTEHGLTLGTPIGLIVLNESHRPEDYGKGTMDLYAFTQDTIFPTVLDSNFDVSFPRPSHADFTVCRQKHFPSDSTHSGISKPAYSIKKNMEYERAAEEAAAALERLLPG